MITKRVKEHRRIIKMFRNIDSELTELVLSIGTFWKDEDVDADLKSDIMEEIADVISALEKARLINYNVVRDEIFKNKSWAEGLEGLNKEDNED